MFVMDGSWCSQCCWCWGSSAWWFLQQHLWWRELSLFLADSRQTRRSTGRWVDGPTQTHQQADRWTDQSQSIAPVEGEAAGCVVDNVGGGAPDTVEHRQTDSTQVRGRTKEDIARNNGFLNSAQMYSDIIHTWECVSRARGVSRLQWKYVTVRVLWVG